jgi:hypothetical protein
MSLVERQMAGLRKLQPFFAAYEVNVLIGTPPGDAPYVIAADVPSASEICSDGDGKYDVWRRDDGKLRLQEANLDAGAAANVIIMEYMREKVQRAKRNDSRLRRYSDDELLAHLLKGYQHQDASA